MVHAIVNPHATDPDNAMTFRTVLSPAEAGRMEKGGASYGNTDLPNLRSAAVAEILTALIDGCQQMGARGWMPGPARRRSRSWMVKSIRSTACRTARHAYTWSPTSAYLNDG
jgi:hypothetical protein